MHHRKIKGTTPWTNNNIIKTLEYIVKISCNLQLRIFSPMPLGSQNIVSHSQLNSETGASSLSHLQESCFV